jgi:hypothetical protein
MFTTLSQTNLNSNLKHLPFRRIHTYIHRYILTSNHSPQPSPIAERKVKPRWRSGLTRCQRCPSVFFQRLFVCFLSVCSFLMSVYGQSLSGGAGSNPAGDNWYLFLSLFFLPSPSLSPICRFLRTPCEYYIACDIYSIQIPNLKHLLSSIFTK